MHEFQVIKSQGLDWTESWSCVVLVVETIIM